MNTFADNIIFVLKNLGIIDFTKTSLNVGTSTDTKESEVFSLSVPGAKGEQSRKAELTVLNGTYILLSGSAIKRSSDSKIAAHNYVALRSQLEKDGYFDETDSATFFTLNKDIEFTSPSSQVLLQEIVQ